MVAARGEAALLLWSGVEVTGSLHDRVCAGDGEAVWTELRNVNPAAVSEAFHEDAWRATTETMRRVRRNLSHIRSRLEVQGYRFCDTNCGSFQPIEPMFSVDSDDRSLGEWLNKRFGPVPFAVQAFIFEVGDICFLGRHPDWPDDGIWEQYSGQPSADPICVEFRQKRVTDLDGAKSYYEDCYEAWLEDKTDDSRFLLDFSPDWLHKENISGGSPYAVHVGDHEYDGVVVVNDVTSYFVDYLRCCILTYGGFYGFRRMPLAADMGLIAELTRDLEPF